MFSFTLLLRIAALLLFCLTASHGAITAQSIQNGDIRINLLSPPKRAVTMNQSATEIMLALGLHGVMVGTAFLDDSIHQDYQAIYNKIPVLSKKYPSKEIVYDVAPDFVYAGYASAFSTRRGLADRNELKKLGIRTYLSPSELLDISTPWTIDLLYQEVSDIGRIFQVENKAGNLVNTIRRKLKTAQGNLQQGSKPKVLWLDNIKQSEFYVGAGDGVPNEIIRLAGGVNVFSGIKGKWASVSKELILDKPVDLIVTIDANWCSAENKQKFLKEDILFRYLDAVKNNRFVAIGFSSSTPGIRIPEAVSLLHAAIGSFGSAK